MVTSMMQTLFKDEKYKLLVRTDEGTNKSQLWLTYKEGKNKEYTYKIGGNSTKKIIYVHSIEDNFGIEINDGTWFPSSDSKDKEWKDFCDKVIENIAK